MHRRNRLLAAMVIVGSLALAIFLSACGSSSDSTTSGDTSGGSSEVTSAAYKEFSKPIEWPGPNEAVKPPANKSITIITCGSQGITCVRVANGAKAAAAAAGYDATVVDGQSNPTVWNQAVQSAISNKADGIVLAAVPPALVSGAFAKAKAAGIKIASVLSVVGPPSDTYVNIDRKAVATANSAWINQDSGGSAQILMVSDNEFPETKITSDAYPAALKAECPGCKIAANASFTLALASQRLATDVAQALQQNPDINYIVLPFDTVNTFVIQGIAQAGKSGQVKIVGLGADPPSFEAMAAGNQAMSLGTPAEWMGWDAIDGLIRAFAGKPQAPLNKKILSNYEVPMRYVTPDTPDPGPTGWPDFDYESHFTSLWGK